MRQPVPVPAVIVAAVVVAAATTLGFWLGASGDAVGALLLAATVLLVVLPGGACLAAPALLLRPDRRAVALGLALDGPTAWDELSLAGTVTVRRPEDPLRPSVLAAFHELDVLGLRAVLVLDDASADPGTVVDPWLAVDAVRLGRRARRLVRQNVAVALAATVVLVPLAASGLLGLVPTALAAVAAAALVVVNSCRIQRFRSRRPPAHRPPGAHLRHGRGRHGRRQRHLADQREDGPLGSFQSAAAPSPLP